MKLRPMLLPRGWYPATKAEAESAFDAYESESAGQAAGKAKAAISPHAGWYYSGSYAYAAFRSVDPEADCVVVFGGHRPSGSALLASSAEGFDTPLGTIEADAELLSAISAEASPEEDGYRDNTVEVLLPLVKRFFPTARLVWLRVPNDSRSQGFGSLVALKAAALGRKAVAIGSTDLTHYGPDYGFCPKGLGKAALQWVREVNDKSIVDAFLAMDGEAALKAGEERQAACSAGAAAAAIAFAREKGAAESRLLGYGTSADRMDGRAAEDPEQFVGYCAMSFT
jgi:MEMO1 family protein